MKKLFAATLIALALSTASFAGDIPGDRQPPPPPATTSATSSLLIDLVLSLIVTR